jgi:hypothetical protein
VAKCDRICDELLKLGKIKISHTLPPPDEIKKRAYCKFHHSYSHATNDCNSFRQQIKSAINEGHLVLHKMQADQNPFPVNAFMNTIELLNPKVLIRPDQADKAKGKNIIIREQRLDNKLSLDETPKIAAKASTLGGQGTAEKADGALTGQATAQGSLTGSWGGQTATGGLTVSQSGLTAISRKIGDAPKRKVRPSLEELLAKYKRKGAARKQKNQPNGARSEKAPPRHEKRESAHHQQGNFPYSFVGSVTPCSWYYPCYYSPTDYSSMYMKPDMIQYPIAYPNYGKLQRPIAQNNNLVKNNVCATIKQGGGSNEQNSKCMQPRWCPSCLSRSQKRRLQQM